MALCTFFKNACRFIFYLYIRGEGSTDPLPLIKGLFEFLYPPGSVV
ncbi:Uncharacterised protein [Porphyromonas crevioricanis]|uniref:Uncharacterized protein n=1 Tax=Porphyromonas crevioricanis TaxID=393921 RepID=A0A2X4PLW3_9PORP|nr:hypothetical protein PORCAN_2020 [Porphyromonas crevioricanis JCM 13913]SQH73820.1 Uncharacterised protein [Porphyromonas crevioricanis]